jgi:hypothetical protein
MKEKL